MNTPAICAMMLVHNEEWAVGYTARAALMWADRLVILDHNSTDGTAAILAQIAREHPGRVFTHRVTDQHWQEMDHRQCLLDAARNTGALWGVIVDADEILSGNLLQQAHTLLDTYAKTPGTGMSLPMVSPYHGLTNRRVDGNWGETCQISWGVRLSPGLFYRARDQGYQLHHRHPMGMAGVMARPLTYTEGGVVHFQFVTKERLQWKALYYKLIERLRWPNRMSTGQLNGMYGWTLLEANKRLELFKPEYMDPYKHLEGHFNPKAMPWQAQAARDLWAQHGAAKFSGIDTYGLL